MSGDKKVFHNLLKVNLKFKPKSKQYTEKLERKERMALLKSLLNKKCRRLNNKERIELINLLSKKENLTYSTLDTIIQMKDEMKLNNVEINNLNNEILRVEEDMKKLEDLKTEKLKLKDEKYNTIEKNSLRLNKFLTKYD